MVMKASLNFLIISSNKSKYFGALHLFFYLIDSYLQIFRGSAAFDLYG